MRSCSNCGHLRCPVLCAIGHADNWMRRTRTTEFMRWLGLTACRWNPPNVYEWLADKLGY